MASSYPGALDSFAAKTPSQALTGHADDHTDLGDAIEAVQAALGVNLGNVAAASHNHNASQINDGTLALARIPTGTTSSTVALGNHTHSGYAATSHTHTIANVTNLQTTLDGKAAVAHAASHASDGSDALTLAQSQVTNLTDDLAGKAPVTQPINAQTGTTYTLQASDAGKLVTLNNTGAITLNAPGSVFTAGQRVDVLVLNTGMATVVGTSGATANGTPTLVSRAQYSAFTVVWLSATSAVVIGDMAAA